MATIANSGFARIRNHVLVCVAALAVVSVVGASQTPASAMARGFGGGHPFGGFGHPMGGLGHGFGHPTAGMRTLGHTTAHPVSRSGVPHTSSRLAHNNAERPVANNHQATTTAGSHNTSAASNKPADTKQHVMAANNKPSDERPAATNKPTDAAKDNSATNVPHDDDNGRRETPLRTTDERLDSGHPFSHSHDRWTPGGRVYTPIAGDDDKFNCCEVTKNKVGGITFVYCKKLASPPDKPGYCKKAVCTLYINGVAHNGNQAVYDKDDEYSCDDGL